MSRLRTALALLLIGCGGAAQNPAPPVTPTPVAPADPSARRAPDFTLTDTDGNAVTLSKLLESGPVILAFFPKAFSGG